MAVVRASALRRWLVPAEAYGEAVVVAGKKPWEKALGHNYLGSEHQVLAILSGPQDDPARLALEAQGVTHERMFQRIAGSKVWPPSPYDGPIATNPAWHEVTGWADGFAAARGERRTAADVLLGVVYSDGSTLSLLGVLGVVPEDVVRTLGAHGCPTPGVPPPSARFDSATQRAGFAREHLSAVLHRLNEEHPPEAPADWGFNYDFRHADTAYVLADESVDLRRILADVGVADFELVSLPSRSSKT